MLHPSMTQFERAAKNVPLFQLNRDVDKDGTVDISLMSTFSGAVPDAGGYECQYEDNAGQTATIRSDVGKVWFKANSQRQYRARWRTINWVNIPGPWSSWTGYVTPSPQTGAPAAPNMLSFSPGVMAMFYSWSDPPELDYDHTELAIKFGSPGTPSASEIVGSTIASVGSIYMFPKGATNIYFYARHVNTSGLKSSWVLMGSGDTVNSVLGAKTNIGSSNSGSVNPGAGVGAMVTVSFKSTSVAAGVTLNLNGQTRTVDLRDQELYTWSEWFAANGPYTFSKSGGGSYVDCTLSAVCFR